MVHIHFISPQNMETSWLSVFFRHRYVSHSPLPLLQDIPSRIHYPWVWTRPRNIHRLPSQRLPQVHISFHEIYLLHEDDANNATEHALLHSSFFAKAVLTGIRFYCL